MTVFREHVQESVGVSDGVGGDVVTEAMVEAGAIRIYELYAQVRAARGLAGSMETARWAAREIIEAALKARNNS